MLGCSLFVDEEEPTAETASNLCDDGNPCTFDVLGLGGCVHNPVAYGTSCTLASFCGTDSICNGSGTCLTPSDICDDDNDCTSDVCRRRGAAWSCFHSNEPSGTSCSDSNACTLSDSCDGSGDCIGTPVDTDDQNPCTFDYCNTSTGVVWHRPRLDGSSCEDGDLCNGAETCQSAVCEDGTPVDTDDGNICTTDSCNPATGSVSHTNVADNTPCPDGDVCNGGETCQSGSCVMTSAPDPVDDNNVCTTDWCDAVAGVQHAPVQDGTDCGDGDYCNGAETCQTGTCTAGPALDCDDNDACTTDSCEPTTGCHYAIVVCSDGDACTVGSCDSELGCQFTPVDCDDGNICTQDTCDSGTGACEFSPLVDDPCDDGEICTESDRCDATGTCVGSAVDPDDDTECTIDACDSILGVTHEPADAGTPCFDHGAGDGPGLCDGAGVCVSVPASESVVDRVGGQDPDVRERRLGTGRHPVAASASGLAAAFVEVLQDDTARVGVATFSLSGQGLGLWHAGTSILEPDPVVAALPSGGFVVAYDDLYLDGDGLGVVLVRLDENGQEISSLQTPTETTLYGQHSPDLIWQNNRLWLAWQDDSTVLSNGGPRLCVRSFSDDLTPLSGEGCDAVGGATLAGVSWATTSTGTARAWREESAGSGAIEVRWASQQWSLALDGLPPEHEKPAMAELDASHLLVVYTDGPGDQVFTILDDTGGSTTPVVVNAGADEVWLEPSLAVTDDGVFLAYRDVATGTTNWSENLDETYLQELSWDGATLSFGDLWTLPHDPVLLAGDQRRPALCGALAGVSGAVWAAWEDLAEGQAGPEHGDVRVSLMPTPIVREEAGN